MLFTQVKVVLPIANYLNVRHEMLKNISFFSIALFLSFAVTIPQQSPALAQPPACPTGDPANLPQPPLSQSEKSVPSLWLAQKQFGGKLFDRWFVDPSNTWVIIIVNRQLWSLLDYMERYQFVNRFGTVSSEYGYNMQVCNRQGTALAVYSCKGDRSKCQLELESLSNPGLRSRFKSF
jgi:hypothetical protein